MGLTYAMAPPVLAIEDFLSGVEKSVLYRRRQPRRSGKRPSGS
jgi:hypothetical protein